MCKALSRFGFAAVCLAVRAPGLLDPHFDALREAWVAVPEFWSTARERRREALSRDAVHSITVARLF